MPPTLWRLSLLSIALPEQDKHREKADLFCCMAELQKGMRSNERYRCLVYDEWY